MATTKITLSADTDLVAAAKKLAAREGTSLSSMFRRFLVALLKDIQQERPGPITRQATGLAKVPRGMSYRELVATALAKKYELER